MYTLNELVISASGSFFLLKCNIFLRSKISWIKIILSNIVYFNFIPSWILMSICVNWDFESSRNLNSLYIMKANTFTFEKKGIIEKNGTFLEVVQ